MPDSKLDLSDIPESTDAKLRRARRVGRPASGNAKQLIPFASPRNCSVSCAAWPPNNRKPYQTLIHELLEESARRVA